MDCPSEENLIRMALSDISDIRSLSFDLQKREMHATHQSAPESLLARLQPLKLGTTLQQSSVIPAPAAAKAHQKSTFSVPKMDCPSEENLIRMALNGLPGINSLNFDLSKRQMSVIHEGDPDEVLARLQPLNLGAQLLDAIAVSPEQATGTKDTGDASEARTLKLLLLINGLMFFFELGLGFYAQSTGLIADSLDMLADAFVYGVAIAAVGKAASMKVRAAHTAGWLQLALALGALFEVVRRFIYGSEPVSSLMMGVGLVALIANVACLVLISRKRDRGAHMTASYIFSANDVIANMGVIAAGALVAWSGSPLPDLFIGTIIAVIVLNGARRILQLR
ncbi:MAG: cation transporter [Oxalobacteraceae bacterium]|nr:MAG: cation transporter [Oxalobacteraceae bacterium]